MHYIFRKEYYLYPSNDASKGSTDLVIFITTLPSKEDMSGIVGRNLQKKYNEVYPIARPHMRLLRMMGMV